MELLEDDVVFELGNMVFVFRKPKSDNIKKLDPILNDVPTPRTYLTKENFHYTSYFMDVKYNG